jgi:signal transduction histidine kinase
MPPDGADRQPNVPPPSLWPSEARARTARSDPPRTPLRVLHVEDSDDDSALVMRELRRGGFEPSCERVDTQAAFRDALREKEWDVIISDYSLPGYNGLTALADQKACGKDVPFILVSGTIGEASAVAAMRAGAQDYVLKGSLGRLPLAVEREVRDAAVRATQRRLSEQLVISERMASAGMLAAGVAHEINTPLAVVMTNLEFVTDMLGRLTPEMHSLVVRGRRNDDDPEGAARLEDHLKELDGPLGDAREAVQRIRGIVRDVKLFSRPHQEERGPLDVRDVVESSIRMASTEIRHRARLVKEYGDVPLVDSNEARLGQILLNLLVNAAHAIPEGQADRNEIRIVTRTAADGRAIIEVRDTGTGIPKGILPRIFDPFFTTKPVGVGTGLGLSLCHRMVTDLGGTIAVESEVGQGTVFRVTLPPATNARPAPAPAPAAGELVRRARILVLDDEIAFGRALERSLGRYHDVVTMTSSTEALAQIVGGDRFDAILSDLMMPQLTGMDLYEELCQIAPDQAERMIFLTGGAFTERAREFLDGLANPCVEKPFEMAYVLELIALTLRASGSPVSAPPSPSFAHENRPPPSDGGSR